MIINKRVKLKKGIHALKLLIKRPSANTAVNAVVLNYGVYCQTVIPEDVYCSKCGKYVTPKHNKCPKCKLFL